LATCAFIARMGGWRCVKASQKNCMFSMSTTAVYFSSDWRRAGMQKVDGR
jgi:hypothetical protein